MIVKYRTGWRNSIGNLIERVEVDRETDESVSVKGRGHKKVSHDSNYWDTWEEAHAYLIKKAEMRINSARLELSRAQGFLGNVKGMRNQECKD